MQIQQNHRSVDGFHMFLGLNPRTPDHKEEKYRLSNFLTGVADLSQERGIDAVRDSSGTISDYRARNNRQFQLGSCAAATVIECAQDCANLDGTAWPDLSIGWLYEEMRKIEGTFPNDAGSMPADGFDISIARGLPSESIHPYDAQAATDYESDAETADALLHRYIASHHPLTLDGSDSILQQIWLALDSLMPVNINVAWLNAWFNPRQGVLPDDTIQNTAGGHAIRAWRIIPGFVLCGNHWDQSPTQPWSPDSVRFGHNMRGGDFAIPWKYFTMPRAQSPIWEARAVSRVEIQPTPVPVVEPHIAAADAAMSGLNAAVARAPRSTAARLKVVGGQVVQSAIQAVG